MAIGMLSLESMFLKQILIVLNCNSLTKMIAAFTKRKIRTVILTWKLLITFLHKIAGGMLPENRRKHFLDGSCGLIWNHTFGLKINETLKPDLLNVYVTVGQGIMTYNHPARNKINMLNLMIKILCSVSCQVWNLYKNNKYKAYRLASSISLKEN